MWQELVENNFVEDTLDPINKEYVLRICQNDIKYATDNMITIV